jgi:hypothetical protein
VQHAQDEHEEEEEEEHAEAWSDAASDQQVSAWFDDAQWQQKEAKAAVLAIRKHLRCAGVGEERPGGWEGRGREGKGGRCGVGQGVAGRGAAPEVLEAW